jgi:predicted nucleotidyltransferase
MLWNIEHIWELVHFHQARGKIFSFSEIFRLSKLTPSEIVSEETKKFDPLYFLTQSGKGYNPLLEKYIQFYSDTKLTNVKKNGLGLDTGICSFGHKVYQPFELNFSFLKLMEVCPVLVSILKLPGVKSVYVFGSSLQGCSTKFSDIDLAIQTTPNSAISTRILVKLYLKILGKDVYSIRFGFLKSLLKLARKWGLIGSKSYYKLYENVQNEIWKYKRKGGLKIDAGMFFSDIEDLQKAYFAPIRHLFMYDVRKFDFYKTGKAIIPSLHPIPTKKEIFKANLQDNIAYFLMFIPSKIYMKWQQSQPLNLNHVVTCNWVSFVPTMPEPEYLVSTT